MNINCKNCNEVLSAYMCDIPSEWRKLIVETLCDNLDNGTSIGCDDIRDCETLTSLSSFSRSGNTISITFKDEKGELFTRTFDFTQILDNSLDLVDPKCIATNPGWQNMTFKQKVQAIINYQCEDCTHSGTTSTTTTTTVVQQNDLVVNNFSGNTAFNVALKKSDNTAIISNNSIVDSSTTKTKYTGTVSTSILDISHNPVLSSPVTALVLVNDALVYSNPNFTSSASIGSIAAKSDIVVIFIPGCVVSTTTTTTIAPTCTATITNLAGSNANSAGTITISWTGSGAASYEYNIDGGSWIATSQTSVNLNGLSNANHTINVRGKCSNGLYGATVSIVINIPPTTTTTTTTLPPCNAPTNIQVQQVLGSFTSYSWSSASSTMPANDSAVTSGHTSAVATSGDMGIASNLGSGGPQFRFYAEPVTEPLKTKWQDSLVVMNNGNIGTSDDLFGAPVTVGSFRVYRTEYPTEFANPIQFKVN